MTPADAPVTATSEPWPELPFAAWQQTCETLHLWTQIVGKTRLALAPMQNHWWQVTLYVNARGLTTSAMPLGGRTLDVTFDFIAHELVLRTSDGDARSLPLRPQSVARFHADYLAALRALGCTPRMHPVPVELPSVIPFAQDERHAQYDPAAAQRWWRVLCNVERVLAVFRGRFLGKASPVHFFWGSFDLAATRFSGRPAPQHPGGAPNCPDWVMVEAYSHECSSAGFWPGGGPVQEAAFYSYAYPEPEGFAAWHVSPAAAFYDTQAREFILPYEAVRTAPQPDAALLQFLESTYEAAAELAQWDRGALERPRGWRGPAG